MRVSRAATHPVEWSVQTERGLRYQQLFTRLLDAFKAIRPAATSTQTVGTRNWLRFGAGQPGFSFVWSITADDRLNVELNIDVRERELNKSLFDALVDDRARIEAQFGTPLQWERLDHRKMSRIKVSRALPTEGPFEHDHELHSWAVDSMVRMTDALGPAIATLRPPHRR